MPRAVKVHPKVESIYSATIANDSFRDYTVVLEENFYKEKLRLLKRK